MIKRPRNDIKVDIVDFLNVSASKRPKNGAEDGLTDHSSHSKENQLVNEKTEKLGE